MTPKSRPASPVRWRSRIAGAAIVTAVLVLAGVAVAVADGYQPYEYGPVVHTQWLAPYASYTANQPYEYGPVVHTQWLAPYASYTVNQPYEYGPVVHTQWLAPYAPYTVNQPYEYGPVVHTQWLAPDGF